MLSITENGYGKRTEIDAYRLQSRGGKGIRAMNLTDKTGSLASQLIVHEDEDLMLITDDGVDVYKRQEANRHSRKGTFPLRAD